MWSICISSTDPMVRVLSSTRAKLEYVCERLVVNCTRDIERIVTQTLNMIVMVNFSYMTCTKTYQYS